AQRVVVELLRAPRCLADKGKSAPVRERVQSTRLAGVGSSSESDFTPSIRRQLRNLRRTELELRTVEHRYSSATRVGLAMALAKADRLECALCFHASRRS